MKILETKLLIKWDDNIVQIRYEIDGIVNDTPMYILKDNKLVPLV